ncbi:MAG TPA: hypothetical protein H9761_18345 [Candidatus Eisenbergiella merdavium]|uniref:Uncharacterized protein n=1 Tax=Candidatus Eisenbergiella merdavium TaxID=2838551 RepID=A0A9D2NJY4_9FIRM|nr:hypothetical protein [Candidatus Eisenbergiella merdavium]
MGKRGKRKKNRSENIGEVRIRRQSLRLKMKMAAIAVLILVLIADVLILVNNFNIYRDDTYMLEEIPENYIQFHLDPGITVNQHFKAVTTQLLELSPVFYNVGGEIAGAVQIQICTLQDEVLFEQNLFLKDLNAGEVTKIRTNLPVRAGTYYALKITVTETGEEVPSVMLVEREANAEVTGDLYVDENKSNRTLVAGYTFRSVDSYDGTVLILEILLASGLVLLAAGLVFLPEFRKTFGFVMNRHRMSQTLIILDIIAVFLLSALFNGGSDKALLSNKLICGGYVFCVYLMNLFYGYFYFLYNGKAKRRIKEKIVNIWKERKYLMALLLISFLLRVWMIGTIQRWDAGEYYYRLGTACKNFTFTWDSFWESFRLANHTSLGFSLVMAIGEFLNPRGVTGVQIINLILTLAAICCMYGLFKNYWLKLTDLKAAYFTLLVSVTPVFLGTFSYVNVDYVMAVFFIYLLYSEYRENYILMTFWAVMMTQTKEPGMVVAFGYFAVRMLYRLATNAGSIREKTEGACKDKGNWAGAATGICIVLNMLMQGGLTTWG